MKGKERKYLEQISPLIFFLYFKTFFFSFMTFHSVKNKIPHWDYLTSNAISIVYFMQIRYSTTIIIIVINSGTSSSFDSKVKNVGG